MHIMKHFFYIFTILSLSFLSSCQNEDIDINDGRICSVDVTVSLSDFYSCYDFIDTKHHFDNLEENRRYKSMNAAEIYQSFCTYYDILRGKCYAKIKTRVLFYNNDNGLLVDSILTYSDNANEVIRTIHLPTGTYTAIATLTFKVEEGFYDEYWSLKEKESLNNVYLENTRAGSIWSIMSYDSREIVVGEKKENEVHMTPTPVGALCYAVFQNFQNNDKITDIMVYTDDLAQGFRLDPNSTERVIFKEVGNWSYNYLLWSLPSDYYEDPVTCYQSDVFDYFYILAPQSNMYFAYCDKSTGKWRSVEMPRIDIENGKTYLAYWDYNHWDKPYFGIADNEHWN